MPFVIRIFDGNTDFYAGSTYVFQGGVYPCVARLSEAKRYKSEKVAKNSAESLSEKCSGEFDVIEVSE